ncbi:hypothetical protein RIR_e75083_A0A2N1N5H2_9GLOM [Rhizophagus irregularis DAOM 181602=DAOM 197198]|nr:hypothetical protein RIR_e75083_A0A2N1N5H2_9GLOM [Rhizophagus irregularis DAOM 181602=DAOM 197198]
MSTTILLLFLLHNYVIEIFYRCFYYILVKTRSIFLIAIEWGAGALTIFILFLGSSVNNLFY